MTAAAPGASGTTARPSAFRHGLARGGRGAGLTQTEGTRATLRLPPPRRQRLSASPQNARRSASHQRICTHARAFAARGPRARPPPPVAAREAQTLGGRVRKGRGATAPPSRARRGGARLPLGPAASGKGLQPARSRGPALESLAGLGRADSAPLLPPPPSGGRYPPAETRVFRGAVPDRRRLYGSALSPWDLKNT